MLWEVDVHLKDTTQDYLAQDLIQGAKALGINACTHASSATGWLIEGAFSQKDIEKLATTLLTDPITESYRIAKVGDASLLKGPNNLPTVVHILPRTGVTDPAAQSACESLTLLDLHPKAVRSIKKFWIPDLDACDAKRLAWKLLASEAIHDVVIGPLSLDSLARGRSWTFSQQTICLNGLNDTDLEKLSSECCLALTASELRAVREHFQNLGREPFEIELETIAQTWSEHCCHKTLGSPVDHIRPDGITKYDNLLKETVFAATQKIRNSLGPKDWCVSVFRDNSGVVRFDGDHDICVKVETHNHPSAIEPYGGAATGLGGVIRDVLGTGLAAKPVANLDVFCVGPLDDSASEIPPGVIHPQRLLEGVVAGVRDYGNRMGIPTIAGGVFYDSGYTCNPLVFCGTVGVMPRNTADGCVKPGDLVVVAGGRTGRDGIHGATFSSIELSSSSETESGGSVQIGHAINEKQLCDFVLTAAEHRLFNAITDCGAGGLSSAVGEMGAELGAEISLDRVPLKYDGLSATEVWISEAQERMVLAVPEHNWEKMSALAQSEGVEATVIGTFTGQRKLVLKWHEQIAGNLDCHFLHDGRPKRRLISRYSPPQRTKTEWPDSLPDVIPCLLGILSAPDVASKEWIIRQYDHEVQGCSVLKPLFGPGDGPADGTVIRGVLGRDRGIVLGVGLRHRLGPVDPYQMAAGGIVEAISNVIAAGADPNKIALLDNFCWGDTRRESSLGTLVEACRACHDMAVAFNTPFVSGKDSLNNVFSFTDEDGQHHELSIPPTLLTTALGQVDDIRSTMSPDLKTAGNRIAIIGMTRDELAGSQLELLCGLTQGSSPQINVESCQATWSAVAMAIRSHCIASCHDISDGGLLAAVAEMAIGGKTGLRIDLKAIPSEITPESQTCDLIHAFSETPGRFICEVPMSCTKRFESIVGKLTWAWIGEVLDKPLLEIHDIVGQDTHVSVDTLSQAWRQHST